MKARNVFAVAIAASAMTLGGCRNPFNPSATIRFDNFRCGINSSAVLTIQQSVAGTLSGSILNLPALATIVQLSNTTKVVGRITGYNVVYRQLSSGEPIATCGGATGRRFNTHFQVVALGSNYGGAAAITQSAVMIVTDELLTHIATDLTTIDGGIDCEVTFYGEDDNGYDIQVEGVLHIDVL